MPGVGFPPTADIDVGQSTRLKASVTSPVRWPWEEQATQFGPGPIHANERRNQPWRWRCAHFNAKLEGTAMFSQRVKQVMEKKKLLTAPPETTVSKAAKLMASKNVGAVMVVEGDRLVGIFTERDAVFRVMAKGRDAETTKLAEVMTDKPQTVDPDKSFGYALLMMHENGFRHVPVTENGKPIGIVSSRNALDPDLEEFVSEAQRRKHIR
jgi:CBS domain-containing protein